MKDTKICAKCKIEKDISEFGINNQTGRKPGHNTRCKECVRQRANERYKNSASFKDIKNRDKNLPTGFRKCIQCSEIKEINEQNFEIYNKENSLVSFGIKCLLCRKKNKKVRRAENRRKLNESNPNYKNIYVMSKEERDLNHKIRKNISLNIWRGLKKSGSSKAGESCLKYLDYKIEELKSHIESLFEPWMNWDNWGIYDPKIWNDNDSSTWKWQLDHIIPHSDLPYKSMNDDNFKICWAINNLRPYSAKQNNIDGTSKIRHKNTFKRD